MCFFCAVDVENAACFTSFVLYHWNYAFSSLELRLGGFLGEGLTENAASSAAIEVFVVATIEPAIGEKVQAGFFHSSWFGVCEMFACAELPEVFACFRELFAPKLYP